MEHTYAKLCQRSLVALCLWGAVACGGPTVKPLFDDEVTRVSVLSWDFFSGARQFVAGIADLTPEQIELLRSIDLVRADDDAACGTSTDGVNYVVEVERGGAAERYDANSSRARCSSGGADWVVDYESFVPFEATIDCATGIGRRATPTLVPSSVCEHGVFTTYDSVSLDVPLHIPEAGNFRLAALECGEGRSVELTVLDGQREELGKSSPSVEESSCGALEIALEGGDYTLRIDKTGDVGGDFFLRFEPVR